MNKVENALEMWANIEGNEVDGHWYCPKCQERVELSHVTYEETHDIDLCQSSVFWNDHPKIDHPFLHGIINGLDDKQNILFFKNLQQLTCGVYDFKYYKGDIRIHASYLRLIFKATVDNILESLCKVKP